MNPPARPPSQDRLLRTVLVMLPFAVLGWLVHLIHGDRATLIAAALLAIGYAGAAGLALARLGVRPPWVLGLVATLVVGWLNVAWHTANWWAGGGATRLSPLAAPLVVTVVGAVLAVVLVTGRLRAAGLVASVLTLVAVPLLVVWAAHDWGDRDEVEDLRHQLEAAGLPPYLPELRGYELNFVTVEESYDLRVPTVVYDFQSVGTNYDEEVSLDVTVLPSGTVTCRADDRPACVDRGDAVLLVDASGWAGASVPQELDWGTIRGELGDTELSSYDDLAQLHP